MNLRKKFIGQFTIVVMLICFISFTLVSSFFTQFSKVKQYKEEISTLNEEIKSVQSQINNLKNTKSYASNEDLESVAREKLKMIKSNELIFIDMGKGGN